MITITGNAQREAWRERKLPEVEQVRDGIWSIPVPFPGNPMRYTLCYLIIGDGECLVIDPGFASDEGWRHLQRGLGLAGVGVTEITGIVATHFHTDHLGLVARLRTASGAWAALGEDERRYISDYEDAVAEVRADRSRMELWGVPPGRIPEAAMSETSLQDLRNLADPDLRFIDGDRIPAKGLALHIVSTPGHTPGHICIADDSGDLFFSGDHVLPRITPNVSLEIRGEGNPLARNLQSLEKITAADPNEVCPAHEYRFTGISVRAKQLIDHSHERSNEVLAALAEIKNPTVWEVARALSWSRGWDSLGNLQLRLALSETAAHLSYLRSIGRVMDVPGFAP